MAREIMAKLRWSIVAAMPFSGLISLDNYIIEEHFQFMVVKFKFLGKEYRRIYRGNDINFARTFIDFLSKKGVKVYEYRYNSRADFTLLARYIPSLKHMNFKWDDL